MRLRTVVGLPGLPLVPRLLRRALLAGSAVALLCGGLSGAAAQGIDPEPRRFALGLFHFNVQYVAGGSVGLLPTAERLPAWEPDAEAVEDQIIRESFEPVLDLFLAHPTWGVDLELQGLMIEVMAERHPDVLDKLRRLAVAGRVEVLSFHHSDQIFLGYPRSSWERSQARTAAVFARHGIPLSTTVFCQEGQAGPGMARAMAERGYRTLVWPPNLWRFLHGDGPTEARYRFGEVSTIVGRDGTHDTPGGPVEITWTFLDDGEKLATGDLDPYFAPFFVHDPAAVARYERELVELEEAGFEIASVSRYVAALDELGAPHAEPPPLLDGTWQPQSTNGVRKWFGGVGLWQDAERDDEVRSLGAVAQREASAAETVVEALALGDAARRRVDETWRLVGLSQVSDASGINPFRGEVEYGIAHATEAMRLARVTVDEGRRALGARHVAIDVGAGSVGAVRSTAQAAAPDATPPLEVSVEAPGWSWTTAWTELEPGLRRLTVDLAPGATDAGRTIAVRFPSAGNALLFSPGLEDGAIQSVPRSAFAWDRYHLMLANGLLGLDAGRFVVKDLGHEHVAATVERDAGGVRFADDTAQPDGPRRWVFLVVDGDAERALEVADRLNVHPRLLR